MRHYTNTKFGKSFEQRRGILDLSQIAKKRQQTIRSLGHSLNQESQVVLDKT